MYLIVGLGNPENDYSKTRHNMGFNVINKISEEYGIKVNKSKFKGLEGSGIIENKKVILLKPQTFMNLSGESVIEAMNFYKISEDELIIIYDDIDIEPGNIRIRKSGSAGTHNGMKSVVKYLGTKEFPRIRVGIGKNDKDIVDYVLEQIDKFERVKINEGIEKAALAVEEILKSNIQTAMNKYN